MINPNWLARLASVLHECENCRAAREQLVGAYRRLDPNGMAKALTRATVIAMAKHRGGQIDVAEPDRLYDGLPDDVAKLEQAIKHNPARYRP